MLKKIALSATFLSVLGACAAPPASPMEKHARLAAGAELAARQCAGALGGYDSVRQMKKDSSKNIAIAKKLGATQADIQKARADTNNTFSVAAAFTNQREACNALVGSLAWNVD